MKDLLPSNETGYYRQQPVFIGGKRVSLIKAKIYKPTGDIKVLLKRYSNSNFLKYNELVRTKIKLQELKSNKLIDLRYLKSLNFIYFPPDLSY